MSSKKRRDEALDNKSGRTYQLKRSPGFYSLVKYIAGPIMNLYYDLKCKGAELIPKEGSFFLAVKHVNTLDVLAILACVDRQLNTLQKIELTKNPVVGYLLEKLGGIVIDREKTISPVAAESMKYTKWLLKNEEAVALFPEMTRIIGYTGKLHPDFITHYLNRVEEIPTFCAGIWYSEPERWLKPGSSIEINIEPADMKGETLEEIADSMGRQMARLSKVEYRPLDSPKYLNKSGPMAG